MKSTEFVIEKLRNLVTLNKDIKCSYVYDESDYTHTVEILPISFFEQDESFVFFENELYEEFYELYPNEVLFFRTEEDTVYNTIEPFFTAEGKLYNKSLVENITTFDNLINSFNALEINAIESPINSTEINENVEKDFVNFQNISVNINQKNFSEAGINNYALDA